MKNLDQIKQDLQVKETEKLIKASHEIRKLLSVGIIFFKFF